MLRCFIALPPYAGSKRSLLPKIPKHLPRPRDAPTLVDPFLGGGAVSLWAKAKGYRVISNDIAERSYIVGKALIENDRTKLTEADALRLFVPHPDTTGFVQERFAGKVLTAKHAAFVDNALAVARSVPEPKRSLLRLLNMKYILRCMPMGNFGTRRIIQQMDEGAWEHMNPNYARDALARTIHGHPLALVEKLRRQVNAGIFSNGHRNEVYRLDAAEFVKNIEGDILFVDAPYPATTPYETSLRPLDEMLAGHPIQPLVSRFSRRDGLTALDDFLSLCSHFPLWVVCSGNATSNLEDLIAVVQKSRPVKHAEEIPYAHCTGLASREHREKNRELLVIAGRNR